MCENSGVLVEVKTVVNSMQSDVAEIKKDVKSINKSVNELITKDAVHTTWRVAHEQVHDREVKRVDTIDKKTNIALGLNSVSIAVGGALVAVGAWLMKAGATLGAP